MSSYLEKMLIDLEAMATSKPKKSTKGITVKFLDPVGNGTVGVVATPELAKAHRQSVEAESPLVKSVIDLMSKGRVKGPDDKPIEYSNSTDPRAPLVKSVMNLLNGGSNESIERLAFETNPASNNSFQSLYRRKLRLLPDEVLKRIALQDDLVAAIVNTRSQMISAFGRPQPDRFSTGYRIEAEPGLAEKLNSDEKKALQDQIERAEALLLTCGQTRGWADHDSSSFGSFLFQQARNAVVFGRCATEIIYVIGPDGQKKFHSFRPIDAGTIYRASPMKTAAQSVRDNALSMLSQIKNKKLRPESYVNDEYTWVQVVEGRPLQAFTSQECLVHNFYPITDIELDGYPLTPIDTVISAVTTHINITTHNKLYFQSGRAARGMLVFKSDDVTEQVVDPIRQQFNANINGVGNAWRMPIFGIGTDDDITWAPIDNSSRDMEFQYLSDTNARVILSAFQMSPEELPGYAHLCLSPDTAIWTHKGSTTIGAILGDSQEAGGFSVWTGKGWSEARAFATGQREVRKTVTGNGITLTTSPEHRFRVVDEFGNLAWKQQNALNVGDTVLVNRRPTPGFAANIPSYQGRPLSLEMAEALGWLTGDGSIQVAKRGKNKHSKSLEFYYHHEKELDLMSRHFKTLQDFGLEPKMRERHLTELQVNKQKTTYGFESVSSVRHSVALYDTNFVDWLLSLGFVPSTEDKAIPSFLHGLPVEYRGAFLKGFFSADGSKDKLNTPSISIASPRTREQTKLLLLGMGIRTRYCEGTTRTAFKKLENGTFEQQYIKEASRLVIKDKHEFYERIGFLQAHKQPDAEALASSSRRWDRVAKSVAVAACDRLLATDLVVGHEARDQVRHALKDSLTPYREIDNVRDVIGQYGFQLPEWTNEFYQETVVRLESSNELMDMVDIEVFDDEHAFSAAGVVVHNSRGTNNQALSESNNEYKLQAHRDVGIRPLIAHMQNHINEKIFPLIDEELAKKASIKFVGLDADTAEKESTRLQQDMAVHMSMDEVLDKVEKRPVGKSWGGQFLLNPQWQQALFQHRYVGEIMEEFFGVKGASQDPTLRYIRDPMWFQWQQLQQQAQQMQQQQQADQQAQQQQAQQQQGQEEQGDLSNSADQLIQMMSKSEKQLPASKRRLLHHQRKLIEHTLDGFEQDSEEVIKQILENTSKLLPAKKKK